MGGMGAPNLYTETKKAQEVTLTAAKEVILEAWGEFNSIFGRNYSPVEDYRCEGAKVLLLAMGSFSETAMSAIDALRDEGKEVGLIKLRLWRPFPFEEVRQVVKGADGGDPVDRSAPRLGQPYIMKTKSRR
ncbi:Pyruvate synthase subunit PorA [subsurface metagenome]